MLSRAYHRTVIEVEARPEPVRIDPARTAVLVIDMQHDFGSPGGMFDAAGIDTACIREVVPSIRRVLDGARQAGLPVVHVRMAHARDLADAGALDGPHRMKHLRMKVGESDRSEERRV